MSEVHSTPACSAHKPSKPYPDYPLFPHATGRWAKKVRGKMHYFGPWADPDAALAKYLDQKDALHSGRTPRPDTSSLTVKELANAYLNHKAQRVESGELSPRSFVEYKGACALLVERFGKGRLVVDLAPPDFAVLRAYMTQRWGPVAVGNVVQRVRSVFKFAVDNGLIDRPVLFGQSFARPSKKTIRLHRAKQGPKLFTADEVRALLGAASPSMRAMVLLGVNCGLGNNDLANLPLTALDLDRGWLDYPRPKTGVPRRSALWPETVQAVREYLAERPEPKSPAHAALAFLSQRGTPLISVRPGGRNDTVSVAFGKLLRALHINGRKGLGFYAMRHVFRTVADEARDQPAADFIMGHESPHMSSHYRERISDERLRAVTDHVRTWLFGASEGVLS